MTFTSPVHAAGCVPSERYRIAEPGMLAGAPHASKLNLHPSRLTHDDLEDAGSGRRPARPDQISLGAHK